MNNSLSSVVIGELARDLTHTPTDDLQPHLSGLIAV